MILQPRKMLALCLALLACAGVATFASAQGIKSLSTGVGLENRAPHKEYSLLLMFAESKGPYLAFIDVTVLDAQGKSVLTTNSTGPWLFVKLPAGDYKVTAKRADGTTTGAKFAVSEGRQEVVRLTF